MSTPTGLDARPAVWITRSGPVLPFRVPLVPSWVAVPAMCLTVTTTTVACVLEVLS